MKIYDNGNGHFHLGSIFIEPSFQNQGIGHIAMNFIDETFPSALKWTLDTPSENHRNHYFYGKHGFNKVGEVTPDSNNTFTLFLYEKNIKSEKKELKND